MPHYTITMGIGTIMDAKKVLLFGSGKANAIKATLEELITAMVPAAIVQLYRHAYVLLDEAAEALDNRHHHGIIEPK